MPQYWRLEKILTAKPPGAPSWPDKEPKLVFLAILENPRRSKCPKGYRALAVNTDNVHYKMNPSGVSIPSDSNSNAFSTVRTHS